MGTHVVLGEGDRDKAFLDYLCKVRGITGPTTGFVGGIGEFGKHLLAMSAVPGFSQCQAILLMSDHDEPEDKSFESIRNQLKEIDFPVPTHPLEVARKQGKPVIAVLMQPYPLQGKDPRGCLETLLIPAMRAAHPTQAVCVDQMLICAGVAGWKRKDAQDKANVRSLISAVYERNPSHGLHLCFAPEKGLIPMDDPVFNETALVLQHFPTWVASNEKSWADWRRAQGI